VDKGTSIGFAGVPENSELWRHKPYQYRSGRHNTIDLYPPRLPLDKQCGAKWEEDVASWDQKACWACGLPHEMQWHMRISASEEDRILLGEVGEEE